MKTKDVKITFNAMEPTEALKDYTLEKVGKFENLFTEVISAEVELTQNVHARGVDDDFRVDFNIDLPNTRVRVEEIGDNMYAIIDKGTDVLARRLKRYNEKQQKWDGKKPRKVLEAEAALKALEEDSEPDNYENYTPS